MCIIIIGGMPTSGKTRLSRKFFNEFDNILEWDLLFDWIYQAAGRSTPFEFITKSSYSSPKISLNGSLHSSENPNLEIAKRKFLLSGMAVQSLINTSQKDGRHLLVEGWMLAPGYIKIGENVRHIYLHPGDDVLIARLSEGPHKLNKQAIARIVSINSYLLDMCRLNGVKALDESDAESFISDLASQWRST